MKDSETQDADVATHPRMSRNLRFRMSVQGPGVVSAHAEDLLETEDGRRQLAMLKRIHTARSGARGG